MPDLLEIHQFFSSKEYLHARLFEGCTYPWQALKQLNAYLHSLVLGNVETFVPEGAHLMHPEWISIGEGTLIEPGVLIQGPCFIGKNCVIRHGAYLRENLLLGDGCVIGHDTEIKHSILFDEAKAAHFNYVGDSILGSKCNLSAGVKCANVRLDQQTVSVIFHNEKIDTHMKKLGAIIGEGAQIGCNCVINPGTVLGKNSVCFPCLNIYGFIPDNGKVKPGTRNIVE